MPARRRCGSRGSSNVPALRYTAHLLLGRDRRSTRRPRACARAATRAAIATVERVQRGLTITLRPGFLEDKGEALRALLALASARRAVERAFESLERAKSQALLGYLANREQLRWVADDPHSRALIEELERLREEHQWFYRLAHEQPVDAEAIISAFTPQQALAEVAARERRMRAITEQLYLHSGERSATASAAPSLRDLQHSLGEDTLLIEFYNDGTNLWAFTLDAHTLHVRPAAGAPSPSRSAAGPASAQPWRRAQGRATCHGHARTIAAGAADLAATV